MRNYIMCINILLTAFQWHMVRRSATDNIYRHKHAKCVAIAFAFFVCCAFMLLTESNELNYHVYTQLNGDLHTQTHWDTNFDSVLLQTDEKRNEYENTHIVNKTINDGIHSRARTNDFVNNHHVYKSKTNKIITTQN